jgi:hypothetical protein
VAQAQVKPAPFDFANSKIWAALQEKDDAILCLRPADRRGWPIPLMHKAFCDFTRHLHEPRFDEHMEEYLIVARRLCQEMPSAFMSEPARRDAFESVFHSFDNGLTQHIEFHLSADDSTSNIKESSARPDVVKTIHYKGGTLVLMLEEFKNEVGDAYMQICRTYEVLCGDPKAEPLVKSGYPVFLLCVIRMYRTIIPNHTF